ncbi:MAG TPA: serine/threonine-protein kinase, partial [Ktedonobacteraceae bacterium]|nr:serine/threonine-protein kinase [Ktedonobacteraceae bacterium]
MNELPQRHNDSEWTWPTASRPGQIPATGGGRVGQALGNYRLVQLLGRGGFAEVYLGEHVHLNTHSAIKVLTTQLANADHLRFREEARIVARLRHPHIVSIHDFALQDGVPFLVMDYAPGGSLRQRHPAGSLVSYPLILSYLTQVAAALDYAHAQRLVHRDVKPENMLFGWHEEIVLSDFGIAVMAQPARQHEVVGTLAYMAPELFYGKAFPASDQYALAVVLYEWLCGSHPFTGTMSELAEQHIRVVPPLLSERHPDTPHAVEQVVLKALAKDPERRYPSVGAFAHAFADACPRNAARLSSNNVSPILFPAHSMSTSHTASSIVSTPTQSPVLPKTIPARRFSRRTALAGLGGVVAAGVIGGSAVWLVRSRRYDAFLRSLQPASPPDAALVPKSLPAGTLLYPYRGHIDVVKALGWSADGAYIASASKDHTVRVWTTRLGVDQKNYTGHVDSVNALAWSPGGQHIASGSADQTVQVWPALHAGDALVTYSGHNDAINALAWSPSANAPYIASGGDDKTVHIWHAADGSDVASWNRHSDAVYGLAWSPDGRYVASASADQSVMVWDV